MLRRSFNMCGRGILYAHGRYLSNNCNVGFIGLGNMGGFMALNLINKGHTVYICDKSSDRIKAVQNEAIDASKLRIAKSPTDILKADKIEVVITMLPTSVQVLEVYGIDGHSGGLLASASPDCIFIDCTTGDPEISKQIAEAMSKKKAHYIDAPVSGGVLAARSGTLTFMIGGPETIVNRSTSLLAKMGQRTFHCGEHIGAGLAAKICNNLLLAISMMGTAEAMALGSRLGLKSETLATVLNASTGRCWSSEMYNPVPGVVSGVPASRDYEGGFSSALMTKDLGLAQTASTHVRLATPLGSLVHQLYRIHTETGYADKDFSSIYQMLVKK